MTTTTRPALVIATVASLAAVLGGCSGDDVHALGEAIEIDYYDSGGVDAVGSGTVEVVDVREGTTTELEEAGFSLDPHEKAAAAYYVDVAFENAGDAAVAPHAPGGEDPDGNLIHALTIIDLGGGQPFEQCVGVPEEVAPGETTAGCTIVLVPEGVEMERIFYHAGGSDGFIYWETE